MFYLLLELNSYRQLKRLKPDVLAAVESRSTEILLESGASRLVSDGGQMFFCFDSVRAGEHEHILDSTVRIREFLRLHSGDLAGFSVYLETTHAESEETALRQLRSMALRTAIEEEAVVSEAAAIAIEPYAQLAKRGTLFVIGEKHERPSIGSTSYQEFMRRNRVVDQILDAAEQPLNTGTAEVILVHGPGGFGKSVATAHAASLLGGPDSWPFEVGPMGSSPYASLAYSLTGARLQVLESSMSVQEIAVWRRHRSAFDALLSPSETKVYADSPDVDAALSFRCLLAAYVRLMKTRQLPPILICYAAHECDPASLGVLESALQDPTASSVIALIICEKAFLPATLSELDHVVVPVENPSPDEWKELMATALGGTADGPLPPVGRERGWEVFHRLVANRIYSEHQTRSDLPPSMRLIDALGAEYVEILYAIAAVDGAISVELLSALMADRGLARVRTPEILNDLRRLGYLRPSALLSTAIPKLKEAMERSFSEQARTISTALGHYLIDTAPEYSRARPAYEFLLQAVDPSSALVVIAGQIEFLLCRRRYEEARTILYGSPPNLGNSTDEEARCTLHLILYISRLRLALLSRDEAGADRVFPGWRNLTIVKPNSSLHGDYLLVKAQYLNARGTRDEALGLVKKAILVYQDADDQIGVARANGEFGLVLLAQGSINGARDYFSISTRTAAQYQDTMSALHGGLRELTTDIVLGYLTRAAERCLRLKVEATNLAAREYALYSDFLRGRASFELGKYAEAEELFAATLPEARTMGNHRAWSLIERWIGRSVAYRGAPGRGVQIISGALEGAEGSLFLGEAYLLLGQYGDAARTIDEGVGRGPRWTFRPGQTIAWDSGFAFVEDPAMSASDDVISHLATALAAFARSNHGNAERGIAELHQLTRPGGTALRDPFASLYLYLYSETLPEAGGAETEDMVTILGKAVKLLQERTSRIDNYSDKTAFLRENYWNSRLIEKAKRYNLV